MRAFIYASVFLLLGASLPGQTYCPFPTDSATWSVEEYTYSTFPDPEQCIAKHYGLVGDTLIGNLTYSKLYGNNRPADYPWEDTTFNYPTATYLAAVREDSTRKVWVRNAGDTLDILYYDYALDSGDTFCFDYFPFAGCHPVVLVDSILIGNSHRRQIHFLPFNSETWIEGIGSTTGWFEWQFTGTYAWQLLCFKENGSQLFGTGYCHCDTYQGLGLPKELGQIGIFPNPTQGEFLLDIGNPVCEKLRIRIYSLLGELVQKEEIGSSRAKIDVGGLKDGLYFIRVQDGQGLTWTTRLMKSAH